MSNTHTLASLSERTVATMPSGRRLPPKEESSNNGQPTAATADSVSHTYLFTTVKCAGLTLGTQSESQLMNAVAGIVVQGDVLKCAVGEDLKTGAIKFGKSYFAQ